MISLLLVEKIVEKKNRLLLYGDEPNFYVVAPLGTKVEVDDIVEYDFCTLYFGIFRRVIKDWIH